MRQPPHRLVEVEVLQEQSHHAVDEDEGLEDDGPVVSDHGDRFPQVAKIFVTAAAGSLRRTQPVNQWV